MSNAKWLRAIAALERAGLADEPCVWKFVDSSDPYRGHLPPTNALGATGVEDCGAANGTFEFSLIEWLEIPHEVSWQPYPNAPKRSRQLPTAAAREALDAAGQFRLIESGEGLRLIAYE